MKLEAFNEFSPASREVLNALLAILYPPNPSAPPQPPPQLPATGFVREREVLAYIPISKSTLWVWIKAGRFPAPVTLGPKRVGWRAEALHSFIACPANWSTPPSRNHEPPTAMPESSSTVSGEVSNA